MKRILITFVLALFSLSGCHQFSLSDELQLASDTDESNLDNESKEKQTPVTPLSFSLSESSTGPGDSIDLQPSGGVGPYSYSIEEKDIFYRGSLGSFSGNEYISGDTVGDVRIVLEDSQGHQLREDLSLLPPAPHTLSGRIVDATKYELDWSYNKGLEKISGFLLVRVDTGNNMTTIPIPEAARSYRDEGLNAFERYSYYIRTIADDLYSIPSNTVSRAPL